MQLPTSFREDLVEDLDSYLENYGSNPDSEAVAAFVVEMIEAFADEEGYDDLLGDLEEAGAIDGTLQEALEAEFESNDEFEFTGEEVTSLLEKLAAIVWDEDEPAKPEETEEEDFL